jgi:DNA-binding NarL/FixJ family response regulator
MKKTITLLLVEDHSMVRQGLRALIGLDTRIVLVGEASTGKEAVALTTELQPDVVIMDIAMPGLNGFEATRQILKANPKSKILVLSAHSDDEYVTRMIQLGVMGYLVKQNSIDLLLHAIHEVSNGRMYFSPVIAKRRIHMEQMAKERGVPPEKASQPLTSREAEVLQRVAEGEPNKQIAGNLGISIKTVEKHRQQLMDKLHIHDTAGLTRYAIASGVIESRVQPTFSEDKEKSGS